MDISYTGVMERQTFSLYDIKNVLELTAEHLIARSAQESFTAEINRQLATYQSPYRLRRGKFIRTREDVPNTVVSFGPAKIGEWELLHEFEPAVPLGEDLVIEKEETSKKKKPATGKRMSRPASLQRNKPAQAAPVALQRETLENTAVAAQKNRCLILTPCFRRPT